MRAESRGAAKGLAARVLRFEDGFCDTRAVFTALCRPVRTQPDLVEEPHGVRGWVGGWTAGGWPHGPRVYRYENEIPPAGSGAAFIVPY